MARLQFVKARNAACIAKFDDKTGSRLVPKNLDCLALNVQDRAHHSTRTLLNCSTRVNALYGINVFQDKIGAAVSAHSFWRNGVLDFVLSPDGQSVLTTGYDGTVCCFSFKYVGFLTRILCKIMMLAVNYSGRQLHNISAACYYNHRRNFYIRNFGLFKLTAII